MSNVSLPSDVVRTVSLLLEDLGTPISLSVAIKLRYGEWDGISEMSPDPRMYLDAARYARDAAACAILRKLQELPGTHDRRGNAIQKWWQGERDCYKANERLQAYLPENRLFDDRVPAIDSFLELTRKIILSWLGPIPPDDAFGRWDPREGVWRFDSIGRFGPGATYSDRGGKTTVPDKMSADPSLTRDAVWYLPQWLGTAWGASVAHRHGELSFVPGNRFATVPKTSKTDRAIASEPSINVFFQLGLGRAIRSSLKRRAGWDLDRAQDVHRQVACTSSVTREFATLDLSNASDTVARTLVKVLLPRRWFEALDDLRSKKTLIDKRWVVLEKFSSMGNGFTFELETVIFAALACAATQMSGGLGRLGVDVFVFGDDIIVKNDVARPLKSVLEFCGFKLNDDKSFYADEPFRESCGGDFFAGKPVRPYFLKELPNGPQDYFSFANGLRGLADRLARTGEAVARRAWFSVLDCIPTRVRSVRGPEALGDLVLHDEPERWTWRWRRGIRHIQVLRPHRFRIKRLDGYAPDVCLACLTYGVVVTRGGVIPRDGVLSYKVGWMPFTGATCKWLPSDGPLKLN